MLSKKTYSPPPRVRNPAFRRITISTVTTITPVSKKKTVELQFDMEDIDGYDK